MPPRTTPAFDDFDDPRSYSSGRRRSYSAPRRMGGGRGFGVSFDDLVNQRVRELDAPDIAREQQNFVRGLEDRGLIQPQAERAAGAARTKPQLTPAEIALKASKEEMTRASTLKARTTESAAYHKKNLKAFDEGAEGLELAQLQAGVQKDEKTAGERVGIIRGALTPGVSAGDETEEAKAAQGRLAASRERLQALAEKRARIERQAQESDAMSAKAKAEYHRLNDDRLGLTNEGLGRAAVRIDTDRLKMGLAPIVNRPEVTPPRDEDYNPDDWVSRRVKKVNEERAANGRSDFIDPKTMAAYDGGKLKRRPGGEIDLLDESAIDRAAVANEKLTGISADKPLSRALELGRLKASGVTHVGSQPIDKMIERYGGEEAVESGRLVQSFNKAKARLAEIDEMLPGMTDKAKVKLAEERDVLTQVLAEKVDDVKERGLWDEVRDPYWFEKANAFTVNAAKGAASALVDTGESLVRNAKYIPNLVLPGVTKLLPDSLKEQQAKAEEKTAEFAQAMRDEAEGWNWYMPKQVKDRLEADFITGDVAKGVGSTAAFFGPSVVMSGIGRVAGLGEKALSSLLTTTVAATGAASNSNSFRREAMEALRPQLDAGEITREEFDRAAGLAELAGGVLGATEAVPFSRFARRVGDLPAGKTFMAKLLEVAGRSGGKTAAQWMKGQGRKMLVDVVSEGLEEAGQEWVQAVASDLAAKQIFDPERDVDFLGAAKNAAVGGLTGLMFSGVTNALQAPKVAERYRELGDAVKRGAKKKTDGGGDAPGSGVTPGSGAPPPSSPSGARTMPEPDDPFTSKGPADVEADDELAAELGVKKPAPAEFVGVQEMPGGPGFELYNLTADIPGHPKGSSVSRETLEKAGFTVPARPATKNLAQNKQYNITPEEIAQAKREANLPEIANTSPEFIALDNAERAARERRRKAGQAFSDAELADPGSPEANRLAAESDKAQAELKAAEKNTQAWLDQERAARATKPISQPSAAASDQSRAPASTPAPGPAAGNTPTNETRSLAARVVYEATEGAPDGKGKSTEDMELEVSLLEEKLKRGKSLTVDDLRGVTDGSIGHAMWLKAELDKSPQNLVASLREAVDRKLATAPSSQPAKQATAQTIEKPQATTQPGGTISPATAPVPAGQIPAVNPPGAAEERGYRIPRPSQGPDGGAGSAPNTGSGRETAPVPASNGDSLPEMDAGDRQRADRVIEQARAQGINLEGVGAVASAIAKADGANRPALAHVLEAIQYAQANKGGVEAELLKLASGDPKKSGLPARAKSILDKMGVQPAAPATKTTPAAFVSRISSAAKVRPASKQQKFLADFARRLSKAAPDAFSSLQIKVVPAKEWADSVREAPDSRAAFQPGTNTLFLNADRVDAENIVELVVHEAGHFAERFYLGEEFTQAEWEKLSHEQRLAALKQYDPTIDTARISVADLMQNRRARAEWVAMQFARVVRGDTQGMSAKLRAGLEKFLRDVREMVRKWIGDESLTTAALDAKILEMLGYTEQGGAVVKKSLTAAAPKAATAPKRFKASAEMKALGDELFGAPKDKKTDRTTDMFDSGLAGEDFTLQGQQMQDASGVVDREEARREAKKKADEAQGSLFGAPAEPSSAAFKAWFGESVVTLTGKPHGKPLVVYHGTAQDFTRFKHDGGWSAHGFYFSSNPEYASAFAKLRGSDRGGDVVVPAYLRIKNPLDTTGIGLKRMNANELMGFLETKGFRENNPLGAHVRANNLDVERMPFWQWLRFNARYMVREAAAAGYDGIKLEETGASDVDAGTVYFAFDPTQIKSAIGNRGAFSPTNPDIVGAPAETFNRRFDPEKVEAASKLVAMIVRENPDVRSRATLAAFIDEQFPKARPFSESIFRILGGFTEVEEGGSFAAAYSAGEKRTSPTAPRPPSNARTELAPKKGQGSGKAEDAKPKKKGKRISVGTMADGSPDILNEIEALGGVMSRRKDGDKGGENDDITKTFTGVSRLLLRGENGLPIDEIAKYLADAGKLPDGYVTTLTDAVAKAVTAREKARRAMGKEEYAMRFERAFLGNENPRVWLRAGAPISVDDLNVGDEFEVEGEKFTVKAVDEDGNVTIKDGITRVVPPGTPVFPDKGKITRAKQGDYFDGIETEETPNESSPDTNLARAGEGTTAGDRGGAAGVQTDRAADGATARPVGERPAEQAGARPAAGDAALARAESDQPLPEFQPGTVGPTPSPHGNEQSGGSRAVGETGALTFSGADTAVDSVASERPSGDAVAASRDRSLAQRVAAQRAAESVEVIDGDAANIAASLPVLLPEQHDDVLKAERRLLLEKAEPGDPKRGVMFTNGTGTGKTFTGLGIIKRMMKRGKGNILILVPSFKKSLDWKRDGALVSTPINVLESTSTGGKGAVVTTYANFRMNDALRARDFDLVVYDESHKLMENEQGSATSGFDAHRTVTNHPGILQGKAEERVVGKRPVNPGNKATGQEKEAYYAANEAWLAKRDAKRGEIAAEATRLQNLTKTVFLSATPFAYHKTLRYADGYLFETSSKEGGTRYNEADGFDAFLVSNFGYRMRYNKVTQPESGVDIDLMERAFADRLMKSGAVSGRAIDVPFDYSREFILVDAGLGADIDRGLGVLRGWEDRDKNKWQHMSDIAAARFKYHYVQQLLEAIKAGQSIARIREHIALGRKAIVFHSYVNATPTHPFRGLAEYATSKEALKEVVEFEARYPELVNLEFGRLANPLQLLQSEFGEAVVFYNGTVSEGKRVKAVEAFNDDASPVKIIVGQVQSIKEGVSLHDTTGKHMRVGIHYELPIRPTDATQEEGRGYRIGQASNTAHEYVVLHTNAEKYAFGSKINVRVRTAENLALGSQARALQTAFKQGYLNPVSAAPSLNQGKGGKESDRRTNVMTPFDQARSFYFSRQKKTSKNKSAEGVDYFATPEPLGLKMVEWLHAKSDEHLLEPSAGHGAIARFFPAFTTNHFVEPSVDLINEARIKVEKGSSHNERFEDFYVGNKFDGIAMNPPFGVGGKTAIEHLGKAVQHLKDGGRVVALIPEGPMADKRFAEWYENAGKQFIKIAEFGLPTITFERAGTAVKTRIVVIDRIDDDNQRTESRSQSRRDIEAETVEELFEKIEGIEVLPRTAPKVAVAPPDVAAFLQGGRGAVLPVAGASVGDFASEQFNHTKTGAPIYVAKPTRHLGDGFQPAKRLAAARGGYYSSFKGAGAIPGFHFKTAQQRDGFIDELRGQTLGAPAERVAQPPLPVHPNIEEYVFAEIDRSLPEAEQTAQRQALYAEYDKLKTEYEAKLAAWVEKAPKAFRWEYSFPADPAGTRRLTVVSQDPAEPGRWRASNFDRGFWEPKDEWKAYSHITRDTKLEVVKEVTSDRTLRESEAFGSPVDRPAILSADETDDVEAAQATARTLRQAVRVASGGSPAVSAPQSGAIPSLREQEEALTQWADAAGLMIEPTAFAAEWRKQGSQGGAENQVYFDEASQRYVKRNALLFNDDWVSFFRRIMAHNRLFPDTAYLFHGFTPMDDTQPDIASKKVTIQAVLSQPVVRGEGATIDEIGEALTARGFEENGLSGQFEDERFILDDLGGNNVIKDEAGNIRFIDPQVSAKPGIVLGSPAESSAGGLTPPKNAEVPGQPGYRFRSHPDTLIERGLDAIRQVYKTQDNATTAKAAKAFLDNLKDDAAAVAAANDDTNTMPGAVRTAVKLLVEQKLVAIWTDPKADPKERAAARRKWDRLVEAVAERGTDLGQEIQAFDMANRITPDGVLLAAGKAIKARQEKIIGEDGKKAVDEAADALQKENEKVIDEATADMNAALRAVKVGKSIWQRYRDSAVKRWISSIENANGEKPAEPPPLVEFTNRLVREVQARIDDTLPKSEPRPPRTPAEIIREAVDNRAKYKEAWDAAREQLGTKYADRPDVLEKLDEAMMGLLDRPYSDKTLDRAIKEAHKEMGETVRDLARMHYRQTDALGQTLAEKIAKQAGLKPEDAERLANLVKLRMAKLTAEAKKKVLARLVEGKNGRSRRIFGAADRIIELSNFGALTKDEYFDAVAKELDLPGLSDKQAAKLRELAEKAQTTPEGFQRDRVLTDLLTELQKVKGIGPVDVATAVYYAHILSGYTTQMVNAVSTAMNTAADVAVMIARRPTTAAQAIRGIRDGARTGFVQAMSILDTGYAHRSFDEKMPEVAPILEALAKDTDRNAALRAYAKALRYVQRGMKAMDAVFVQSASEAHQRVSAARLAAEFEGGKLNWQQRSQKVRDLLAMSPAEFEAARQQAKAEGLTGLDYQLRVGEIIRQKRDASLVERGIAFGREATFNQAPRGYLGVAAKAIRDASNKFPPLRLFVPFTNVVANVANASLNYSPVGAVRAFRGYGGEGAPSTTEERDALLMKGIAGSMGLIFLLAYGMGDDDEETPWITGTGPQDTAARNQLRKTGWKPNTVKIGNAYVSYLETPLAIPLAIVGNYIDGVKYNGLDHKAAGERLAKAVATVPETIVSMSFLRGLADFMDAARGRKSWGDIASGVVASATVPNLVRQIDRTFDPKLYEANGLAGGLAGQIPGVRQTFQPRIDVVGKPIETSPIERFGRPATNDELWDTLAAKQAWIPEAGKTTKLGGQVLTPAQYRAYVQLSGPGIETRLRAALPRLKLMTKEQADDFVAKVTREERARVKPQLRAITFDVD